MFYSTIIPIGAFVIMLHPPLKAIFEGGRTNPFKFSTNISYYLMWDLGYPEYPKSLMTLVKYNKNSSEIEWGRLIWVGGYC